MSFTAATVAMDNVGAMVVGRYLRTLIVSHINSLSTLTAVRTNDEVLFCNGSCPIVC